MLPTSLPNFGPGSNLTRYVRVIVVDGTLSKILTAEILDAVGTYMYSSSIGARDGRFFITGVSNCHEYRMASSRELLPSVSGPLDSYVYMEPRHMLEAMGEEAACSYSAEVLANGVVGGWCEAWVSVFKLLGPRSVALALRVPSLAAHLSPEAASLYASEHPELAEAWRAL